ncbi:hypothetical protein ON010_g2448 [Phytophthora cinnamomi]|nr:hypothetical protein ON010_g2448 [Phytophthora cinnamomi]
MAYCLADGIYPGWPVFIKSLPQPLGNKQKKFAERQEYERKDVEPAFGVRSISELGATTHSIENEEQYFKLQHDVMEHIWRVLGEEE